MAILTLSYLYATIAFMVSGYAYFAGVVNRPRPIEFTFRHRAILGLTTLAAGMLWIFFVPTVATWYFLRLKKPERELVPIRVAATRELSARG